MYARVWRILVAVIVVVLAMTMNIGGCGEQLISRDQEIQMGRDASAQFERQNGGRVTSGRAASMAATIGARIGRAASAGSYYDYPYEFRVLNNRQVNANAFPGGIIYLWTGLFEALNYNEDQLAWVAGHEAVHVAERHATDRIGRQLGYDLIIQLVLGRGDVARIAGAVSGLTLQAYGRDQELQSDRIGSDFTRQAGYDPTAALAVLETFKRIQGRDPSDLEIFFATHPGNTMREDRLKEYFRQQGWSGQYYRP